MNEITKLYENAEVKKQIPKVCSSNELYCKECEAHIEDAMPYCKNAEHPPFTAEKQLELIRWLGKKEYTVRIEFHENEWGIATECYSGYFQDNLAEALSSIINTIWQDLTEEEKQQIKEILE